MSVLYTFFYDQNRYSPEEWFRLGMEKAMKWWEGRGSTGELRTPWLRCRKLKMSLANADSSEKVEMKENINRELWERKHKQRMYTWQYWKDRQERAGAVSTGRRNGEPENDLAYFNNWEGKGRCAYIERNSVRKRFGSWLA